MKPIFTLFKVLAFDLRIKLLSFFTNIITEGKHHINLSEQPEQIPPIKPEEVPPTKPNEVPQPPQPPKPDINPPPVTEPPSPQPQPPVQDPPIVFQLKTIAV